MHDLNRAYAAEPARTADQEPDQQAATNRLLDHYVGTNEDRIIEAVAHQGLGLNYSRVGQHHRAGTHLREAIRLNASLGRHRGVMTAHLAAAILCDKQGRHEAAIDHNLLALAAAEAAGDLNGQVGCLGSIGWQIVQLGRYHEGIAYCESVGDYVSREILVDILTDTEEHIEYLETQLDLIDKVGLQNYLQSQMEPGEQ